MNALSTITTSTAQVWLAEDGITHYQAAPGADVGLTEAQETHEAVLQLQGNSQHPLLADIRQARSISREARHFFAGAVPAATTTAAVALLVESQVSRMIGRFFLRLNHPPYPMQMFDSEPDAIAWLKGYVA
jgi:hypothetical protein